MLPGSVRIWLAVERMDMRRGHDGLIAVVKNAWGVDPFNGHLFVFLGKRRDRCKIVFYPANLRGADLGDYALSTRSLRALPLPKCKDQSRLGAGIRMAHRLFLQEPTMDKFRRSCVAAVATIVVSLVATSPAFAVGFVGSGSTKIMQIAILGPGSAGIVFSTAIAGKPACHTSGSNIMIVDLSTNKGRAALSLATAAQLANVNVVATGTGNCSAAIGSTSAENLDTLIVNQ